jgi:beta-glucosidase
MGDDGNVLYSPGCHLYQDKTEHLADVHDRIAEARTVAAHSDVVILCVGLDELLEGEEGDEGNNYASGDKVDLKLPACQRKLMEAMKESGKPIILCLMAGSDIDLSYAAEHYSAVLQLWYPGAEGGAAVARTLFGEVSAFGKLPITFYETLEELPDFTDYSMEGRTYRYIKGKAQYPFGYGLNYGKVTVTDAQIVKEEDNGIQIKVTLENTGTFDTDEVVQLYIKHTKSPDAPLHPQLCGFKRVSVKAKERREVFVSVDAKAFTIVNQQGARQNPGGAYHLYAGISQPDQRSEELLGTKPIHMEIQQS